MYDEDDIQDALADFAEDVSNGQAWSAAMRILSEDYEIEQDVLERRARAEFGDLNDYQTECRAALDAGDKAMADKLATDKAFLKQKEPNLKRMDPVKEHVSAILDKGPPAPGTDWWPYMPIKRYIDTLFPAPGDVRDVAFWTARNLIRERGL